MEQNPFCDIQVALATQNMINMTDLQKMHIHSLCIFQCLPFLEVFQLIFYLPGNLNCNFTPSSSSNGFCTLCSNSLVKTGVLQLALCVFQQGSLATRRDSSSTPPSFTAGSRRSTLIPRSRSPSQPSDPSFGPGLSHSSILRSPAEGAGGGWEGMSIPLERSLVFLCCCVKGDQ